MTFGSIIQGEHETLQSFVVRLRSSATECEFNCPVCTHDMSPINIKDQFIRGLYNTTLQTDILSKANQLNALQETVKHAEAFETALRDQTKLSNEPSAEIFSARDTTNRNTSVKFKPNRHKTCSGCGSFNHGSPGSNDRSTKCPAWGKTCNQCGRTNHSASVCRQTNPSKSVNSKELIAHIKHNLTNDTYTPASPTSSNEIFASITPGHFNSINIDSITLPVFPDSGASICLAGTEHLKLLNIDLKELIPSSKRISVVGG